MSEQTKALAVVNTENYQIMQLDKQELMEVMQENLGVNGGLSSFDLDRIKVPSGGMTVFEVPTLEGTEARTAVEGVIVFWTEPRAYWTKSMDEGDGNTPPDCSSPDGVVGHGLYEGQACATCPLAQFGSDPKGTGGQACKQMRLLFMVNEDSLLPFVVQVPPTSIKPIKQYFLKLASKGVPYYGVKTKLTLEKAKNGGGITYAKIVPALAGVLSKEDRAKFKAYQESIKPALSQVEIIQQDDVVIE
jgi:hypothetical protein